MTLVEFLRARLADDERVAREAQGNTAHFSYEASSLPVREHITRWTSARVLAEVAAKRRQIDHTFRYEAKIDGEWGCCHSAESIARGDCLATSVDEIEMLRLLALPYAGHPDCRQEWAL